MNIVGIFFNNELRTGGHVRYLELMEGLASGGHRVVVLLNSLLAYEPRVFEALRFPVRYKRKGFPPASAVFAAEAGRRAKELGARMGGKVDAVLVFGETHVAAGEKLKRAFGCPLIYGHRSNTAREYLTYLDEKGHSAIERARFRLGLLWSVRQERNIARAADIVVFQSSFDMNDFLSRVPVARGRTFVVRGDILGPRFKPEWAGSNRSERLEKIAFMGTQGPRKGVDYLIGAIALLKERGFGQLRFEICGPGQRTEELEARLAADGTAGMATIHGRVPDAFPVVSACDLLVVPSLFDSYPNSVLEALHAGTPVIGSRVGGIPDMLSHDELLFPPMDAKAIADIIEGCVRDPGHYRKLKSLCAGRADYFRFDWAAEWAKLVPLSKN
jgi:glycosyltransferase involved in cell wall biosynthesis